MMTDFIWFSSLRYLISSFRDSTWYSFQLTDVFLAATFLQQIFAQGRKILMPLFRHLPHDLILEITRASVIFN